MYCNFFFVGSDTETLYTKATQNILDPFDKTYTWDFKETIMGLAREVVGTKIIEHYDLPISLDDYLEQMNEQIALLMPDCVLLPGNNYKNIINIFFLLSFSMYL
jgi:pseudouridine 5'-phosphatase